MKRLLIKTMLAVLTLSQAEFSDCAQPAAQQQNHIKIGQTARGPYIFPVARHKEEYTEYLDLQILVKDSSSETI